MDVLSLPSTCNRSSYFAAVMRFAVTWSGHTSPQFITVKASEEAVHEISKYCPTTLQVACSRLSDSGGDRKMLERQKKNSVLLGNGGAGTGKREDDLTSGKSWRHS